MPKLLLKNPTDSIHVVVVEKTEGSALFVIKLLINVITSYFKCWNTSCSEYEDGDLPRTDFSAEAPHWDPSYQYYAQHKEETIYFSGANANDETTKKIPSMVINQVSLGTGAIDVSSDDKFGLTLERNINVSNKFDTSVSGKINTMHRIMWVGTSFSKNPPATNHEMVQERRGVQPSIAKNMVACTT